MLYIMNNQDYPKYNMLKYVKKCYSLYVYCLPE